MSAKTEGASVKVNKVVVTQDEKGCVYVEVEGPPPVDACGLLVAAQHILLHLAQKDAKPIIERPILTLIKPRPSDH